MVLGDLPVGAIYRLSNPGFCKSCSYSVVEHGDGNTLVRPLRCGTRCKDRQDTYGPRTPLTAGELTQFVLSSSYAEIIYDPLADALRDRFKP